MENEFDLKQKVALYIVAVSFWSFIPTAFFYGLLRYFGEFNGILRFSFLLAALIWLVFCLWYTYKLLNEKTESPSFITPPQLVDKR